MNPSIRQDRKRKMGAGVLVLMGSGELTSTMVEVHKMLLRRHSGCPTAVFLNTPAGFQLNVDELSERARSYFRDRIGHRLETASLRSRTDLETPEGQRALQLLRNADYILMGPGSPTYAVRQWKNTPVPKLFIRCLERGGTLVAASAEALTLGIRTLPVYEIYKVGEEPHWKEGLDVLGHFGFQAVVVPHWNNAEGGTHDTRFCYMGMERFRILQSLLPETTTVLGIDEHTALILDAHLQQGSVCGVGSVTVRRLRSPSEPVQEWVFHSGESIPFSLLEGEEDENPVLASAKPEGSSPETVTGLEPEPTISDFWTQVRSLEKIFEEGLSERAPEKTARALLTMDRLLWEGLRGGLPPEDLSQGREIFREWIASLAQRLPMEAEDAAQVLQPFVERLLDLRNRWRSQSAWEPADALRQALRDLGVIVEDTPEGTKWRWDRQTFCKP